MGLIACKQGKSMTQKHKPHPDLTVTIAKPKFRYLDTTLQGSFNGLGFSSVQEFCNRQFTSNYLQYGYSQNFQSYHTSSDLDQ